MVKTRNKKFNILPVLLILVIFGVIGYITYNQSFCIDCPTAKYIEVPVFGYLSCSPTETTTITKEMSADEPKANGGNFGQVRLSEPTIATPYTCKDFLGVKIGRAHV